ncbi:MAG: CoA-binding protein [Flavobacteriales bacterium]|nr:CoA-binding protein [Flavobacteriales bacterium]
MTRKYTVVIGASPNPQRYSHRAIEMLSKAGHPLEAVGIRNGEVSGVEIKKNKPNFKDVDTVTLYVGPRNQDSWIDYIKSLKPQRVIFNPGTENLNLENELEELGIQTERACTLVLLSAGSY